MNKLMMQVLKYCITFKICEINYRMTFVLRVIHCSILGLGVYFVDPDLGTAVMGFPVAHFLLRNH